MLTYLINVTDDILLASVIVGTVLAFAVHFLGEKYRAVPGFGIAAGFIAAAIRAYITNTRRLVGGWKVGAWGYGVFLAAFVILTLVYFIFIGRLIKEEGRNTKNKFVQILFGTVTAFYLAAMMFVALPNVFVYPFKFDAGGNGILSTDYLFRLGGYLLGLIVCLVALLSTYKVLNVISRKGYSKYNSIVFIVLNTIYAVFIFAKLMSVLTPRKIINSTSMFKFAAASNNNAKLYTYAAFLILLVIAAILWIKSKTMKEPYNTKAQRRKLKALWRTGKRYSVSLAVCFVMAVLCTTLFVELDKEVIREAPVEEPIISKNSEGEEELLIPLESVCDGHLHRFGYTTPDGNPTRLIVILKQENTNNYGIGLDACEICGEAGYYENKDGQVVCKKCNVVMNTTTIGLKGGCNPIIIDYDIDDTYIIVPATEMINNQSRFKK